MHHDTVKKSFKLLINLVHAVQVACIFLSFFVVLYWIIELAGLGVYVEPFSPFFEGIRAFVNLFYIRKVAINNVMVDFSFLIAVFIFLLIAFVLRFVVEYIEVAEKQYDSYNYAQKRKEEDKFNKTLEQEYLIQEFKNNKFLFLINFSTQNLLKDSFYNRDANDGTEEKAKEILESFSNAVSEKLECQKKILDEGLLLFFNNFENVDNVFSVVQSVIAELKLQQKANNWNIKFYASAGVYASAKDVVSLTERLVKLLKLNLSNKILCLAAFKQRYFVSKKQGCSIESQGVYKITEDEEVYSIKSLI